MFIRSFRLRYDNNNNNMATAENKWVKVAWRLETLKENSSIINDAIIAMQSVGKQIEFEEPSNLRGTLNH